MKRKMMALMGVFALLGGMRLSAELRNEVDRDNQVTLRTNGPLSLICAPEKIIKKHPSYWYYWHEHAFMRMNNPDVNQVPNDSGSQGMINWVGRNAIQANKYFIKEFGRTLNQSKEVCRLYLAI